MASSFSSKTLVELQLEADDSVVGVVDASPPGAVAPDSSSQLPARKRRPPCSVAAGCVGCVGCVVSSLFVALLLPRYLGHVARSG